jgi:aerotaxis receptor
MRLNEPVTQREYEFPDDATLMSTTDTQSHIVYANAAFIEVSGFTREEIVGQPHNLVRHPDMPAEAFADMWKALKSGEPWTALVKNRRKNGDHYWVRANAIPIVRDGRQVGYMSVRTKPSRQEIDAAEKLYQQMREGKLKGRKLHRGLLVRTGLLSWSALRQTMPVRWRIRWALWLQLPVLVLGAWYAGLTGSALLGLSALMATVLLIASWMLETQIAGPLEQLRKLALRIASGESQKAVHMNRVDEIGITLRTVSQLGLMFRWLIDDVSNQVMTVQTASTEISQGNADLSSRTEHAASSVQQTATSMEQMTGIVAQSADSARQANSLAATAANAAEQGGKVVAEVVDRMRDISSSSNKITDIIGTIDSIAFQTNILALNAAVEAARAGEQGRGFAVVATEVRQLAARAAQAAKEIKALIGVSAATVETGSRQVEEAGAVMQQIVNSVRRVSDLIGELSSSSIEQKDGIDQVNNAVSSLDQITQQNAALVEQAAAASSSLRRQADLLVEAVSVFR